MIDLAATNPFIKLLLLLLVFAVVSGAVLVAVRVFESRRRVARQFARVDAPVELAHTAGLLGEEGKSQWAVIADRIERSGLKLTDSNDPKLEKLLKQAGYRNPSAPKIYTLARLVLLFVLPAWYLLLMSMADEPPTLLKIYLYCTVLAALGLYIPNLVVRAKADRRRTEIINGFPDALDLLLVCVEAGLGLEAALDRVGREVLRSHPLIGEVFIETTLLMRAGAARDTALRRMADSAGVDEIRSFSTLLIQSDKLGTSIAATLRVYAGEMREARRMRAEEKAHRLPVLISIPLVMCMLPTMIGVLALPAIVRVVRDVIPALSGGG